MNESREKELVLEKGEPTSPGNYEEFAAHRDYSKLRKAAASQSLSKLKEAISLGGWTAKDIDDNDAFNHAKGKQKQRQHASKSALHMAAWKGCLDNVKYLIETVGCDIDAYSKQEFSYGKTAIFFALTQSRPEITKYLLRKGAKVTIVNNKGQSVLSMAATHFSDGVGNEIIQTIREMENVQGDWWNFRATHSDGFEYGDLDPRFFNDRPLRETDKITPLAINPTDKQTRKGGFLRRNPGAAKCSNAKCNNECFRCGKASPKRSKKRNRKKAKPPPALSAEEQCQLDRAWESLLASSSPLSSSSNTFNREFLLEILRLSDKQRSSWIPQATTRLIEGFGKEGSLRGIEAAISHPNRPTQRQLQLLEKILVKLQAGNQQQQDQQNVKSQSNETRSEDDPGSDHSFESSELWMAARPEVADLRISLLENTNSPILRLPDSPIFVDNTDALRNLLIEVSKARLVAIDTEWYTPPENITGDENAKPKASLSTLQLSIWDDEVQSLAAYVVDLIHERPSGSNREYHHLAESLVRKLLEACGDVPNAELPLVLGFAVRHDLPMLRGFLEDTNDTGRDNSMEAPPESVARRNRSCHPRVLDLQIAFAIDNAQTKQQQQQQHPSRASRSKISNLPGLKACVSRYSSVPLSKDCQCSDWGRRPLSITQLEYAGLDAAILLVLLAERSREGA